MTSWMCRYWPVLLVVWGWVPSLLGGVGDQLGAALFMRVAQSSDASANNVAAKAVDGTATTSSRTQDNPGSYWMAGLERPYPLERGLSW